MIFPFFFFRYKGQLWTHLLGKTHSEIKLSYKTESKTLLFSNCFMWRRKDTISSYQFEINANFANQLKASFLLYSERSVY